MCLKVRNTPLLDAEIAPEMELDRVESVARQLAAS
jgi:hypothetical protein